jgi:tetratricopeptide (TPR) repeat protein
VSPSSFYKFAISVAMTMAMVSGFATAQDGGRFPVRVVAGRLLFECDISTPERRIPVNLFLDLDTACGLQLHNKAASPLKAESADGQLTPITLHFPDFRITVPGREHGDEDFLDDFTKYHSAEMGENAVVGTLGAQVLKNYHLIFDLPNGYVEFSPAHEPDPTSFKQQPGSVTVAVTMVNDLVWLPVVMQDGRQRAMALGGSRYDSVIDRELAGAFDAPAGDVGEMKVSSIDLAQYVAFRPEELIQIHPDRAVGIAGINVFENFRIEIDRNNSWVRLTPHAAAEFPVSDLEFFRARYQEEPEPLEAYLEKWPEGRLASEAADLLLWMQVDNGGSDEQVQEAMRWRNEHTVKDLRATAALDLMKIMAEDGWPEYLIMAGEIGIESGRDDRYPEAIHKIHARLGEVHLAQGNNDQAWRHLLSAAFGLPEDGLINLNLGRFYEQQGRYRRAFSRFVQASIKAESGPQAIEALQRVQPMFPQEEPFSVDLIERMIEGKVMNFGAASKYEADPETATNRVVLIEFFTNGNFGDEKGGAIAGALTNEALLSHFKDGPAAFLSYHLPVRGLEPLVNPYAVEIAALRKINDAAFYVINGTSIGPGAGKPRDREKIYRAVRELAHNALKFPSDFELEIIDLQIENDVVTGKVVVSDLTQGALLNQRLCVVLAERGVLYPGLSTSVIHRMLARASLTPDSLGVAVELEDGTFVYPFEQSLSEITAQNEAYLEKAMVDGLGQTVLMSTKIDPKQVSVVAYLRDPSTGVVVQAVQTHYEEVEQ